jgi:regulatory protein
MGGGKGSPRNRAPAGIGRDVPPDEAARLECLRLLSNGPRTRAQLAGALRRRGVPDEAAESVLGRFAEVGLIDDAAFARAWVESRHYSRGLAGRRLAAELQQRGIGPADVRAAVGSLAPEEEIGTARRLVAKRLAATRGRPLPGRVRQLVGLLARKGYSAGLAYRVVREALEQEGADLAAAGIDLEDLAGADEPAVTEELAGTRELAGSEEDAAAGPVSGAC